MKKIICLMFLLLLLLSAHSVKEGAVSAATASVIDDTCIVGNLCDKCAWISYKLPKEYSLWKNREPSWVVRFDCNAELADFFIVNKKFLKLLSVIGAVMSMMNIYYSPSDADNQEALWDLYKELRHGGEYSVEIAHDLTIMPMIVLDHLLHTESDGSSVDVFFMLKHMARATPCFALDLITMECFVSDDNKAAVEAALYSSDDWPQ